MSYSRCVLATGLFPNKYKSPERTAFPRNLNSAIQNVVLSGIRVNLRRNAKFVGWVEHYNCWVSLCNCIISIKIRFAFILSAKPNISRALYPTYRIYAIFRHIAGFQHC